jgi:hypothetical protein
MPLSPSVPDIIPIPGATGQFLSPDTTKTTRTDFTGFFLRFQHAPDAHPHYKHLFIVHQEIARLLIKHPAMERNLQQTFSTPANSKNKVYFMWDFILRTFQNIAALVDPRRPYGSPPWSDVLLRAAMASGLMLDTTGQLEEGNASVGYYDDAGIEFGDEAKDLAKKLVDFPDACVCGATQKEDGGRLRQCAKCKKQQYCSTECQKDHWKSHKKSCGK